MDTVAIVLVIASAAALAWVFAGFSIVVAVWGNLVRRRVRRADHTPALSVVVAAHDEESCIAGKLENTLAQDYPSDRLQVIVASDGSTDRTVDVARGFADRNVTVLSLPRRGKIATLEDAVPAATGEVLVFTDANTMLAPDALRRLVRSFADPDVGGVCGNQVHRHGGHEESVGDTEGLYWKYDKWLKGLESATGSIVSADGALYAIRRELYRTPPSRAVNDDFSISTSVVAQGKRLVFEAEAMAVEPAASRADDEFERKVRILSRGLWSVIAARELLNPFRHGFYALVLFTHKVLRRLTPLFLAGLLAGSLLLAPRGGVYAAAATAQAAFYLLAAAGGLLRTTRPGRSRVFGIPFFFCLANAAALVAILRVIRGQRAETWQPKRRDAIA